MVPSGVIDRSATMEESPLTEVCVYQGCEKPCQLHPKSRTWLALEFGNRQ